MTTALITGAAGGIGYELARQLAALAAALVSDRLCRYSRPVNRALPSLERS